MIHTREWGLLGRIALAGALLVTVYLLVVDVPGGGSILALLLLGGVSLVQYFYGDPLSLRSMGAHGVSESDYPSLRDVVTRLSRRADVPEPHVAVADSTAPDAFATGRTQRNAVACATTGPSQSLEADDLDGVLAHELARLGHRDVAITGIASFPPTIAFSVVRWGRRFGGGANRKATPARIAVLVSLVVRVVSFIPTRALSRYRGFAADGGAATITGRLAALASASPKTSGRMDDVPDGDLAERAEMNAFSTIPIRGGSTSRLAGTHPPTGERIEQLRRFERNGETIQAV